MEFGRTRAAGGSRNDEIGLSPDVEDRPFHADATMVR
ncbi:hypothetical protein SEA_CLARK_34 [Gordonia phage Clark]|uniref:Uncharacterized protein n=2 Tax=Beenievirus TaxID=3044673 RepID=A0A4Y6EGY3_9CAUD|nr:hypothetical protein PP507_gp34 [Gordonia phage Clark]YP_010654586.1 hypothetical protein PP509_gp34 [Gordonia phage MichaelScott]QDF17983.1 hypothetical protein SEA_CLARK_34 [Gordonia phage Clark]QOC56276.1 hypothetical protein SEA_MICHAELSCOTT_34 [Gordonia phage MichaelScott]